jgi:hypothetical protein
VYLSLSLPLFPSSLSPPPLWNPLLCISATVLHRDYNLVRKEFVFIQIDDFKISTCDS